MGYLATFMTLAIRAVLVVAHFAEIASRTFDSIRGTCAQIISFWAFDLVLALHTPRRIGMIK
jgi:hypothetical protein